MLAALDALRQRPRGPATLTVQPRHHGGALGGSAAGFRGSEARGLCLAVHATPKRGRLVIVLESAPTFSACAERMVSRSASMRSSASIAAPCSISKTCSVVLNITHLPTLELVLMQASCSTGRQRAKLQAVQSDRETVAMVLP